MYRAVTIKVLGAKGSRIQGFEGSSGPKGIERREADEARSEKLEARAQKSEAKRQEPRAKATDMGEKALAGLLRRTNITVSWDRRGMRTLLDGRDVSEEIRAPEVSGFVSEVSAIPAVREKMVAEQRRVAAGHSIVCEGRDIGSVVFPDADLKIFLECDTRERARRRQLELWGQGVSARQSAVQANLEKRDRIDSGREVSPLRRMPDAILVDTTHLTIEEQVAVVCDLARRGVEGSRIRGF
jgi:cytidylate kinase